MEAVTWLRPEYIGREDELITLADGARLVGVSRSAVSNWAKRHANFPRLALLTGPLSKRVKYVVREELLTFARIQLNKTRKDPGSHKPRRPAVELRAGEVQHFTQQVNRLTELVDRHKQTLAGAEARLRTARQRLRTARTQLTTELAAVHKYSATEKSTT
ncbi:hypothetical protein [Streptomyces halobius]|uniref:Helix-turn-helix protein n=1 Tax=Streptomyces halobius TaxID=2879846 RepID=A0ABY4MBC3_9ACTN|nr:hypothetical protein [Streptomyces halobius]UQA93661.1 hypothetical protein K9S39_18975 [Streptomyces halobius]